MKSHQNEILEKMNDKAYLDLSFEFAFKLSNESERGAILIGTSKIEEYLERLITTILPSQTKAYKSRLLGYPGPLSSFSGKIELTYAFRLIDKKLYQSLNSLRIMRNKAAHTSHIFSLKEANNDLTAIYSFEENFPEVIHHLAYTNLIRWKLHIIKTGFESSDLKDYDYEKIWNEKYPNPQEDEAIAEQLIIWKLAYGLTFLCLKMEAVIDDYIILRSNTDTWRELMK